MICLGVTHDTADEVVRATPRLQRATSVKNFEASQELKVDVLPEIVTFFRVSFVSGGQPVERVAKFAGGGLI